MWQLNSNKYYSKQVFLPELITVPHFHTCTLYFKVFFQKYFTKVIQFYKFKTSDNNISGDKIIINQTVKPVLRGHLWDKEKVSL